MSRRIAAIVALLLGAALVATVVTGVVLRVERDEDPAAGTASSTAAATRPPPSATAGGTSLTRAERRRERRESRFAVEPGPRERRARIAFGRPPRAGMLFDVRTGDILWQRNPDLPLPIASLTKMMTSLVIARRDSFRERALITREAARYPGSGVGVLPIGKRVGVGALMYGLMLVSGNDASIALAQHDAGSVPAFVGRMNRTARTMGLRCTHFSTPNGLQNRGNYSCARDLAVLARADLADPKVSEIARTNRVRLRFPVKGGYLDLYNNNPFIRAGVPGITGLKTGYTAPAGRCYVITARRGERELGVVLLDSPDPLKQVPALLKKGATG